MRGGSTTTVKEEVLKKDADEDMKKKYLMEQQILLQLRSTMLSEALAQRGIPISTLVEVSTADGDKPPEATDWDCALSTVEDPKTCLYSFDAEPNTKVVAPYGTDQYISLSALNRLRRSDPSKVEPMWHSKYTILKSWFSDESEYSLLQHTGIRGFILSNVLLDHNGLRLLLVVGVLSTLLTTLPIWDYMIHKILISAYLWNKWQTWGRIAHAALPLKLLLGQMTWKFIAGSFAKLESTVRDKIVEYECAMLEESIPITVGKEANNDEEEDMSVDDDDDDDEDTFFDSDED